jgi:hypothetical protein
VRLAEHTELFREVLRKNEAKLGSFEFIVVLLLLEV